MTFLPNPLLHDARVERGWSQLALADQIGTTAVNISRWENGSTFPTPYFRQRLCEIFGKSPEELGLILPVSDTVQAIQNTVDQVAEANPKNIQEVAASQLAIINSYYLNGLEQSQQSFRWSLIWGGIGLVFFVIAVIVLLFRQPAEVAYVSGIGGAIVEVFAGTYLYLYKHASDQLGRFRFALDNTQRILLANSMCESLEKAEMQSMRAELIRLIVNSATKTELSSPSQ
jgi:transcriptional regulator with XRE-family HTH domain